MGTGTSMRVQQPPPPAKLSPPDEQKVLHIVEVCEVSREEALRVLDACHMDETMAIERFINGTETPVWSQVSKKKKQPQPRNTRHQPYYSRDRRDRPYQYADNSNRRTHRPYHNNQTQRPRDSAAPYKKRPQPTSPPTSTPVVSIIPPPSALDSIDPVIHTILKPDILETSPQQLPLTPPGQSPIPNGSGAHARASPGADKWKDRHEINIQATQRSIPNGATTHTSASPVSNTGSISSPVRTSSAGRPGIPEKTWSDRSRVTTPPAPKPWGSKDIIRDAGNESKAPGKPVAASPKTVRAPENAGKPLVAPSTVKRTFNYAAAVAAGTSHEKPVPVVPEPPKQQASPSIPKPVESKPEQSLQDGAKVEPTLDPKKRRGRNPRKPRARTDTQQLNGDSAINGERIMQSPGSQLTEPFDSRANSTTQSPAELRRERVLPTTSAWGTPTTTSEPKEEKPLEDSAAAVAIASAAVTGGEQPTADSLSLQFGSFALSGIDAVNWSANATSAEKEPEPIVGNIGTKEAPSTAPAPEPIITTAAIPVQEKPLPAPAPPVASVPVVSTSTVAAQPNLNIPPAPLPVNNARETANITTMPQDVRVHNQIASAQMPTATSGAPGSGMFPFPVGPGGNFGPPNYPAPYLMPPLHGYSPAIASYENGSDLNSSRAPNLLPPGSLPAGLYDPSALPGISGTGKYAGIPGLADMGTLQGPQGAVAKDNAHGTAADAEKTASAITAGLPAGMDPLAPPYMMGYPSMQYPMYTFPTGPYAAPPPGMGPGPSPFPYPPAGQVTSQGGRGFGFEDASAGLNVPSRNGAGLGESMYTPGYLNSSMTHTSSQKGPNDASYKTVRGNPGNGLNGIGMGTGMVHGVTYDYGGGIPGVSNGIASNGGAPGSWSHRGHNNGRGESGNVSGGASNPSAAGVSQNSSVYAAGPGGHGGYWTQQQGGYYQS